MTPVLRFRERVLDRGVHLADGQVLASGTKVRDCWLEDDLGEGWMVAYRLVPQEGRPVVAEVRAYPGKPGTYARPGEWSAEMEGRKAAVPKGGLRARRLKTATPGSTLDRHFPDIVQQMELRFGRRAMHGEGRLLRRHGFTPAASEPQRRSGRPPSHDLVFYARLASEYAELVGQHIRNPIQVLAAAQGYSPSTMTNLMHAAREKGMLTASQPGLAGGTLTDRAKALLDLDDGGD